MNGGVNVWATLAICFAIVAGSCGGESERREGDANAGSGATGGSSVPTGGSLAIAGTTGAIGGSIATGGSLATAGTATGGTVASGGSLATAGTTGAIGGSGDTGGSGADGGAGGGGGAGDPSTEGCRGPNEPGCGTCCQPDGANCVELFWTGGEGYNGARTLEGPCPESCPKCAQCSTAAENRLRALGCRADCDCDNIDIGIDPCFGPGSCACYCSQVISLEAACPHIAACE